MKKAAEGTTKGRRLKAIKTPPDSGKVGKKRRSYPDLDGVSMGTAKFELQFQFMTQSWGAMGVTQENLRKEMERYFNLAHAAIAGVNPGNGVERMLAVQLIGAHNMAMEFSRRAMHPQQCTELVDANVVRATQFMKIFFGTGGMPAKAHGAWFSAKGNC